MGWGTPSFLLIKRVGHPAPTFHGGLLSTILQHDRDDVRLASKGCDATDDAVH